MGTRGLIIIVLKGKYIVCYNHWDSYPSGLGHSLVEEIRILLSKYTLEQLRELFSNLHLVDQSIPPTEEEIEKLKLFADLKVSKQSYNDWYCLLRECQGSLVKILDSGYIIADEYDTKDACNKSMNRIMIEHVYTVDLDNNKFKYEDTNINTLTELDFSWIRYD